MSEPVFDESKLIKPGNLNYQTFGDISFFGLTLTGKSHIDMGTPCQDANYCHFTNAKHPTLVAVIADGIGSCALSHYGASIAVKTSVEYLTQELNNIDISKTADKDMGKYIRNAMRKAREEVEKEADEMNQLVWSYQSTLTIAIYDGSLLYYGHIGDDGIVVLTQDGTLEMITQRIKGEEASSLRPLQSDERWWEVGKCAKPVDGFIMATDGVLDGFVYGEGCRNIVYYPFMEPAFQDEKLTEIGKFYARYMSGSDYQKKVTDDMTFLGVRNIGRLLKNSYKFNSAEYYRVTSDFERKVNAALYPPVSTGGRGTK